MKVALVTGGTRGIGRAISARLARDGFKVYINYVSSSDVAQEFVQSLKNEGLEAEAIKADVSDYKQVDEMFSLIEEADAGVDVLVNNAGVVRDGLLVRMKEDDWDYVINTNLKGVFNVTKRAIKYMMKKRWGRIINISSVVALTGNVGQTNYCASKAGVIGFSRALAKEVGSRNITVNVVCPGYIETDMTKDLPDSVKNDMKKLIVLGRFGTPEDVAGIVSFLAGDDAAYITGQVFVVDGGLSL